MSAFFHSTDKMMNSSLLLIIIVATFQDGSLGKDVLKCIATCKSLGLLYQSSPLYSPVCPAY